MVEKILVRIISNAGFEAIFWINLNSGYNIYRLFVSRILEERVVMKKNFRQKKSVWNNLRKIQIQDKHGENNNFYKGLLED